jgi:AbrB family looped-hinge helix DNA binding protein
MGVAARVTSKGQVTVPKAIRDALGIQEGDSLLFTLRDNQVLVEKTPNFLDLRGSVPIPPELRDVPWTEVRRRAWADRGKAR